MNRLRYAFWFDKEHFAMSKAVDPYDAETKYPPAPQEIEIAFIGENKGDTLNAVERIKRNADEVHRQLQQWRLARQTIENLLCYHFYRQSVHLHKAGTNIPSVYARKYTEDTIRITGRGYGAESFRAYQQDDDGIAELAQKRFLDSKIAQFVIIKTPDERKLLVRNTLLQELWHKRRVEETIMTDSQVAGATVIV